MAHMLENNGAAEISFAPEKIADLNAGVAAIEVQGQRRPDAVLAFSNVEAAAKQ
jgi:hypothetical protein